MSPMEIGYRMKEGVKKKLEKLSLRDFSPKILPAEGKKYWYFDVEDRHKIASFIIKNNIWNENKARELLEHKFSFFSFDKKFLGKTINWNWDYKNGKEAPVTFCKYIDYQDFSVVGDFKYIWEINRHQHLISLAKAYYISGNKNYKDEIKKQIMNWIEANPYMKGINWISSLELGIRLISWSWAWFFLGNIDEEFRNAWLETIYKHCVYINKNFSRYSSANNHLIGEAAGLFVASIVWPFEDKSEEWKERSYKILIQEIEKQNYNDGVNKEQAISYQQFVMDLFILAGLLGEKNGVLFPQYYWESIEKMLEFIASIMNRIGNVPFIGDADDGYAVTLSEDKNFNPYQSLLASGAVMFKRGDFKRKASQFDEKSLWLLGLDGIERFNSLEEKKINPVKTFKKGGYYVLSAYEDTEDEIKSVFDCGPLGYLNIAAHGHADALSFTLSVGGKKFLIDPGTYVYQYPIEWRDYFKGTIAHNTIRIDGKDQSVIGGYYMWLIKARIKLLIWESNDEYDIVEGEHNGYMRLKDPVIHRREIFFDKKKDIFKIIDRIQAEKMHLIEQFFHFSEECTITQINPIKCQVTNMDRAIIIKVDKKLKTKIAKGSKEPILGWKSEQFDVKEKAFTMVNSVDWEGSCKFETLIFIK